MTRIGAIAPALALALTTAVARPVQEEFFREVEPAGRDLPADRVFPQGQQFPFSFYSVGGGGPNKRGEVLSEPEIQAALRRAKADGLTMIGPQYELNERALADARAQGMKVNYMIGLGKAEVREGTLTDEEIAAKIREAVLPVVDDDALAWWNIRPEELRPWRKHEMRYLEIAARTIRELDPQKRPIWMYDPGHRSAKGMVPIAKQMDMVGKGMYTNYSGMKDTRVWCRWTIEQEVAAIAEGNPQAIPLAVPEMFQQPKDPDDVALIPSWVRHDVYAALVAGAKGVVVFSASLRPNFPAHELYRESYGTVARELCGEMALGQVFLFGQRRDDLAVNVLSGPETATMLFPSGGVREPLDYPSVSMANVAFGKERYVFLVNSVAEPVEVVVEGLPYGRILVQDLWSDAPEFVAPEGDFPVELGALGVKAFRIRLGD